MNQKQRVILSILKEREKSSPVTVIANKMNTKNESSIIAELDILDHNGYVNVERSTNGKIKRATITESGKSFFYTGNSIVNKQDIQKQIDELREVIDIMQGALNATTENEKKDVLGKAEKLFSVLNGGYQVLETILKLKS